MKDKERLAALPSASRIASVRILPLVQTADESAFQPLPGLKSATGRIQLEQAGVKCMWRVACWPYSTCVPSNRLPGVAFQPRIKRLDWIDLPAEISIFDVASRFWQPSTLRLLYNILRDEWNSYHLRFVGEPGVIRLGRTWMVFTGICHPWITVQYTSQAVSDRKLRDRLRVGKWRIPPLLTRKVSHYSMVILPHVTVNTPSHQCVAHQCSATCLELRTSCQQVWRFRTSRVEPRTSTTCIATVFDSVDSVFCDPGRRQVLIIHWLAFSTRQNLCGIQNHYWWASLTQWLRSSPITHTVLADGPSLEAGSLVPPWLLRLRQATWASGNLKSGPHSVGTHLRGLTLPPLAVV